jgi:hypothetical protein
MTWSPRAGVEPEESLVPKHGPDRNGSVRDPRFAGLWTRNLDGGLGRAPAHLEAFGQGKSPVFKSGFRRRFARRSQVRWAWMAGELSTPQQIEIAPSPGASLRRAGMPGRGLQSDDASGEPNPDLADQGSSGTRIFTDDFRSDPPDRLAKPPTGREWPISMMFVSVRRQSSKH